MDRKVLELIVNITEQKNSDALVQCLLETLSEILPANYVTLYRLDPKANIEVVASIEKAELPATVTDKKGLNEQKVVGLETSFTREGVFVEQLSDEYWCVNYSLQIGDNAMLVLSLGLTSLPSGYELLIQGFLSIYKNYHSVLLQSEKDSLTGLFNRRTFEERCRLITGALLDEMAGEDGAGSSRGLWMAIMDIDYFKRVNDQFGHLIGDEVLLMFAQCMRDFFTQGEELFRFGGEEFVVILDLDSQCAVNSRLESFRRHIESHAFPQIEHITVSIGVCYMEAHTYLPTILDRADRALYYAKENGRNQVRNYDVLLKRGEIVEASNDDNDVELF